jgi:hypothetical protein
MLFIAYAPDEFRLREAIQERSPTAEQMPNPELRYNELDDLHQDGFRKLRRQMIEERPNRR